MHEIEVKSVFPVKINIMRKSKSLHTGLIGFIEISIANISQWTLKGARNLSAHFRVYSPPRIQFTNIKCRSEQGRIRTPVSAVTEEQVDVPRLTTL